ncbi:MAG TPA: hypothetical protein V6C72_20145, partial [Chroococcales cyanobacterium]
FRMETSLVSAARQRRLFAYSEISSSTALASQIIQMKYRYMLARQKLPRGSNLQFDTEDNIPDTQELKEEEAEFKAEPAAVQDAQNQAAARYHLSGVKFQHGKQRSRLALSAKIQLTGQATAGLGDLFEMNLNWIHYLMLRHKNLSPGRYRARISALHTELDSLIKQRWEAISSGTFTDEELGLLNAESKIISDMRDLSLVEFSEFYAATRRLWMFQNAAFMLDLTKNALGVTGNIISLEGNQTRRPRLQGGAGLFSIMSGAVVMVTPFVGRITGDLSESTARRLVSNELINVSVNSLNTLVEDRQRLVVALAAGTSERAPGSHGAMLSERLKAYGSFEKLLKETTSFQEAQRKRAHDSLVENIVFATLVGPPRITNGITQVIGGWRCYTDPPQANKLFAAGSTAYAVGSSINLAETVRLQTVFERRRYKQKKAHSTTADQFRKRLQLLDGVEKDASGDSTIKR